MKVRGWKAMVQGTWPYTVVEVMSGVLAFIRCGCGPGPSGEPGAPPSPVVVPDRLTHKSVC